MANDSCPEWATKLYSLDLSDEEKGQAAAILVGMPNAAVLFLGNATSSASAVRKLLQQGYSFTIVATGVIAASGQLTEAATKMVAMMEVAEAAKEAAEAAKEAAGAAKEMAEAATKAMAQAFAQGMVLGPRTAGGDSSKSAGSSSDSRTSSPDSGSSGGERFDADEGLLEAAQDNYSAHAFMSVLRQPAVYQGVLKQDTPPTSFQPPTREELMEEFAALLVKAKLHADQRQ
ncbi:hypothetical protein Agub_g8272 [Astrephomene gubernaculifera]|uniref:Uncharacterized protein n=1 Tax=Astrephomene gubernaculifera TaxID=47775 RepID=A0AAD3DU37_9CHLO|nr:hypothetical protein Agub_g8272 [Astrephomene gubernaculifera]